MDIPLPVLILDSLAIVTFLVILGIKIWERKKEGGKYKKVKY